MGALLIAIAIMLGLVAPIMTFPLQADGHYKHFARRDAPVWTRWLDKYASQYEGVAYDVAVGGLPAPDPEATETERRAWQYQTALKIDAVVLGQGKALIVEVRPWATVSALGSALCYAMVLEAALGAHVVLVPTIVCEGMQVDVRWAADKLGVLVFEV